MDFIPNSHDVSKGSEKLEGPVTGEVHMGYIHDKDGIKILNVCFLPGARSHWHTHEGGQIIRVVAGTGWVCDRGETPRQLKVGDMCVCPPKTTHWHGADDGSYMVHQTIQYGGTTWHEEVGEDEYARKRTSDVYRGSGSANDEKIRSKL